MKKPLSFFVTGTGTGIGKTFFTAGFARFLCKQGLRTAVMKPVQTGFAKNCDDLGFIKMVAPGIIDIPLDLASPYRFKMPASPHLASRREEIKIDMKHIVSCYKSIRSEYNPDAVLIEGAGGLLVPLNKNDMMADLIKKLGAPVILVADAGLGTLNHTFLSLELLKKKKVSVSGIILNKYPVKARLLERDNVETIEKVGGVPILGVIRNLPELCDYSFSGVAFDREFRRQKALKNYLEQLMPQHPKSM